MNLVPKRDKFIKELFEKSIADVLKKDDTLQGFQEILVKSISKITHSSGEVAKRSLEIAFNDITLYRRMQLMQAMKGERLTKIEENSNPSLLFGPEFTESFLIYLSQENDEKKRQRRFHQDDDYY